MPDSSNPTAMHNSVNALKAIGSSIGCALFFTVSVVVAWKARHYQLTDQPMPNGKGGFMTFRHGYYIASVSFLISVVWFVVACKSWRRLSAQN
jgi:hypothetical protein